MRHELKLSLLVFVSLLIAITFVGCGTLQPAPSTAEALAEAMSRRPVVLLGEVHDNVAQHALRAEALRLLIGSGARPAVAFEQFDRERQADLDRARSDVLEPGVNRVDHLIQRGSGGSGWDWNLYRPYLQLALDHELPIVAANFSRADAMRVAQQGSGAVPGSLPADFLAAHERAVDEGHCGVMPPAMLPALARAQIARDAMLAHAIRPHIAHGVVLLTGNGHVRNDIGVPYHLSAAERARTITIGLLESTSEDERRFDFIMLTAVQPREDPCAALRKPPPAAG